MSLLLNTLAVTTILAILSWLLRKRIVSHKLTIGRVSLAGLHDIHYCGSLNNHESDFSFRCSKLSPKFHFPTKSAPRWFTLTVADIRYQSKTCDVYTASLIITCWFFPLLFRQTAGPWLNAELADLRITVKRSNDTPYYLQLMRRSLVGAVLNGDILRTDDFRTKVRFGGLTERTTEPDDGQTVLDGNPDEKRLRRRKKAAPSDMRDIDDDMKEVGCRDDGMQTAHLPDCDHDEIRISASANGVHINDHEGRYLSFGTIDAQFRRNWTANKGTFVLLATESRWIRTPWPYQLSATSSWAFQLFSSLAHFPYDLVHVLDYPITTINIYVPRVDVTFDNFRIRDAELVIQTLSLVKERMTKADIHWQDVFVDWVANAALGALNTR